MIELATDVRLLSRFVDDLERTAPKAMPSRPVLAMYGSEDLGQPEKLVVVGFALDCRGRTTAAAHHDRRDRDARNPPSDRWSCRQSMTLSLMRASEMSRFASGVNGYSSS